MTTAAAGLAQGTGTALKAAILPAQAVLAHGAGTALNVAYRHAVAGAALGQGTASQDGILDDETPGTVSDESGAAILAEGPPQPFAVITVAAVLAHASGTALQLPVAAVLAHGTGTAGNVAYRHVTAGAALGQGAASQDGILDDEAASAADDESGAVILAEGPAQPFAVITVPAGLAHGAGSALNAVIPAAVAVSAGLAHGAGAALQPPASAVLASGTGAALQPPATAGPVSGTGIAGAPLAAVAVSAILASGAASALQPAGIAVTAGLAAAGGTALNPVAGIAVSAILASGAGSALSPPAGIAVTAGLAHGAGSAPGPSLPVPAVLPAASGTAPVPAAGVTVNAGLAAASGTALNAGGGSFTVHGADAAHVIESAFYYITGADTGHGADSGASIRVSGADAASGAETSLSAWPSAHDVSGKAAERAWWSGPLSSADTAHAAEAVLPFPASSADSGHAAEVLHETGIWTFLPVNVRLLGLHWRITGLDEDGNEITVLAGERLTGEVLELARLVSFCRVVRRVTSADSASAGEALAREPVAVTCWVQPAVAVSVQIAEQAQSRALAERR